MSAGGARGGVGPGEKPEFSAKRHGSLATAAAAPWSERRAKGEGVM